MKNQRMKISFDYDGILDDNRIQRLARALVEADIEVYIVTSRCDVIHENGKRNNIDIHTVAAFVGVPNERIHFTEGGYKADVLTNLKIDIHFDDDADEVQVIKLLSNCKPVRLEL